MATSRLEKTILPVLVIGAPENWPFYGDADLQSASGEEGNTYSDFRKEFAPGSREAPGFLRFLPLCLSASDAAPAPARLSRRRSVSTIVLLKTRKPAFGAKCVDSRHLFG